MKLSTPHELAALIPDGCKLVVTKDETGVSMAVTAALITRQAKDLHLVCLPISGLQADLLIAAGCLTCIETSAVTMGEYGAAPSFQRAIRAGSIKLLDGTCPAIHAGIQASQKGVPFATLRGILDSDLLEHRTDWQVIDNPFAADDPIVAIKAIDPDIALIHAQAADRFGNVFIGRERDCLTLAHAAKGCLVTVEKIVEGNLLDDPARAGSVLPALYIDAIAHVPMGAWPIGFGDDYGADDRAMRAYLSAAREAAPAEVLLQALVSQAPWAETLASNESLAGADD